MKILLTFLLCLIPLDLFAQDVTVKASVASDALVSAIQQVANDQVAIQDLNSNIASLQSQIIPLQADMLTKENDIVSVANQNPPLQPAVDYCNANPSNCPEWVVS